MHNSPLRAQSRGPHQYMCTTDSTCHKHAVKHVCNTVQTTTTCARLGSLGPGLSTWREGSWLALQQCRATVRIFGGGGGGREWEELRGKDRARGHGRLQLLPLHPEPPPESGSLTQVSLALCQLKHRRRAEETHCHRWHSSRGKEANISFP